MNINLVCVLFSYFLEIHYLIESNFDQCIAEKEILTVDLTNVSSHSGNRKLVLNKNYTLCPIKLIRESSSKTNTFHFIPTFAYLFIKQQGIRISLKFNILLLKLTFTAFLRKAHPRYHPID